MHQNVAGKKNPTMWDFFQDDACQLLQVEGFGHS